MIGRTIGGRYKVYDKVGGGGMAEVFLARDLQSGEIVAIKVLREQFTEGEDYIERFEREAKSAIKLTHPNICCARDFGSEEDTYFMVMEFVEGKTLSSIVEENGPLPLADVVSYISQAAKALESAYKNGIIAHRDVKSQNIMVTPSGQVKIMDFGIAKSRDFATMTSAGSFVGTPEYMSPEQAQGEKVDSRSDIYSLGVVFYEALAGEVPFESDTPWGVLNMHINKKPFPLENIRKDVPKEIVDIIERMMTKDPDDRFQTPSELIASLDAAMAKIKLPKGSRIKAKKVPRSNPKRRRKIIRALIIFFTIAILGAGGYWFYLSALKPGNVLISSTPESASIYIKNHGQDQWGEALGKTNFTLESLSPGNYDLLLTLDGYISKETEFELSPGESLTLDPIELLEPGKMSVSTSLIDWGEIDTTPAPKSLTISNTGQSPITIERDLAGADWLIMDTSSITVKAGETLETKLSVDATKIEPGKDYEAIVIFIPDTGDTVKVSVKLKYKKPEEVVVTLPPTGGGSTSSGGTNSSGGGSTSSGGDSGNTTEPTPPPPPPVTTGTLSINCNVSGAFIKIDGKQITQTTPLSSYKIEAGTYKIEIRSPRYQTQEETVTIAAGENKTISVTLKNK
ncbi:MAG TPA: protein kinase [Caldisericia bacterium]|nr:protein kinase [Caldisericia bacterium]HPF48143.1 protein kinase [Caldisericia bacterium]HPI83921.1 protein kinase [Caldisericia bacterium]HPQ92596.1 protein kinase [Caldisericia bacterium]HRV74306.1 protein kinase [Caldisericia bacterium]